LPKRITCKSRDVSLPSNLGEPSHSISSMAEATDDLSLTRDLDDAARADLQQRIADQLEKILEAECDAVLAEYATVLVATEKKSMAEIREALAEMIEEERAAQFVTWLAAELPALETAKRKRDEDDADDDAAPARKGPILSGPTVFPGRGFRGRGRGRGRGKGRGRGRGKGRGKGRGRGRAPAAAEGNKMWVKEGHQIQSPKLDGALNASR